MSEDAFQFGFASGFMVVALLVFLAWMWKQWCERDPQTIPPNKSGCARRCNMTFETCWSCDGATEFSDAQEGGPCEACAGEGGFYTCRCEANLANRLLRAELEAAKHALDAGEPAAARKMLEHAIAELDRHGTSSADA